MSATATLVDVSQATLADLRRAVASGALQLPLSRLELRARGLASETAQRVLIVLGQLPRGPLLAVLDTVLAERERAAQRRPRLLWTGPEATGTAALDTRVQLLQLLQGAQRSVFLAGYVFDDPELLRPLYEAMAARGVDVTVVLNIKAEGDGGREDRIRDQVRTFLSDIWPGRDLAPRLYVDPRTAAWNRDPASEDGGGYFVSMHAKAVIVDAEHVILGSANFTGRGTNRNIEAGVLLHSREFAKRLLRQWEALIAGGVLRNIARQP